MSINRQILLLILVAIASAFPVGMSGQETFKRGLERITFIPKGQWITGVSVNYSQSNQKNYQFLIIENLNGDAYSFKVSPMLMFAFKDNLAAGGKFSYERTMANLESGNVIIDSETDYDIDNLRQLSSNYFATAALRYYISLGNSTRFGLFNEMQLKLGGGESKIINGSGDDLTGTFERNFQTSIGLSPGFVMFLSNYSAIEVNVGVLGFGYTHTRSTTDHVYVANRKSKQANFKVNLFSISFGVAFYL